MTAPGIVQARELAESQCVRWNKDLSDRIAAMRFTLDRLIAVTIALATFVVISTTLATAHAASTEAAALLCDT